MALHAHGCSPAAAIRHCRSSLAKFVATSPRLLGLCTSAIVTSSAIDHNKICCLRISSCGTHHTGRATPCRRPRQRQAKVRASTSNLDRGQCHRIVNQSRRSAGAPDQGCDGVCSGWVPMRGRPTSNRLTKLCGFHSSLFQMLRSRSLASHRGLLGIQAFAGAGSRKSRRPALRSRPIANGAMVWMRTRGRLRQDTDALPSGQRSG